MTKAVIDRFEGTFAILLIGDDEQRMEVSRQRLPEEAKEGDWLQVEIQNGEVSSAVLDQDETAQVKKRIADKLARLRSGAHLKSKPDK